ncbi:MAG: chemotaxis protein CheA, partial [Bdellovibrionaceae bacterium]|nr:chemotaxis protein CheA [Pseudobdellovibrionaceae bacterium]
LEEETINLSSVDLGSLESAPVPDASAFNEIDINDISATKPVGSLKANEDSSFQEELENVLSEVKKLTDQIPSQKNVLAKKNHSGEVQAVGSMDTANSEELTTTAVLAKNPTEIKLVKSEATEPEVPATMATPLVSGDRATVVPMPANKESNKVTPQPATSAKTAAVVDESIRVSLSRLEKLQNYVGEMVILQSVLREQLNDSTSLVVKRTAHQLGKVVKEIQDISMNLRMVPVKPTFQKMQRIVRDTAQALNKDILFKISGEETELDKTVLEKINDPLVHLIRNSVDHGIEPADQRIAKGKKAQGEVQLNAYHQSGKLVIEVKDDGGGLDAEKLKKVAISKGILKPGQVLTEYESWNLIFAPGFSTKEQVTDVSGRGVGMDVVKTNIQELSGEIQIVSEKNVGTTFKVVLPLTLAIIDGMVVSVNSDRYVIPLSHVHESLKPDAGQIQFNTGLGEVLLLRGENLPLYRLGSLMGKKASAKIEDMIAIVIRTGKEPFAVMVDDIIGQYQVVIKQLGPELQNLKGFSGSTILGDGRPSLIIEPLDLVKARGKSLTKPQELGRVV